MHLERAGETVVRGEKRDTRLVARCLAHQGACTLTRAEMQFAVNIAQLIPGRSDGAEERDFVLVGIVKLPPLVSQL